MPCPGPGPAYPRPDCYGTAVAEDSLMPVRLDRIVAAMVACVGVLAAVDQPDPREREIGHDYTYEDIAAGKDIHEGVYHGLSGGEFDEWRIRLGTLPALDRVQVKSTVAGAAYPGPVSVETDKTISKPPFAVDIQIEWILGDFDKTKEGWFYSLGFEYYERDYKILYAVGASSPALHLFSTGVSVGMGYARYVTPHLRYEIEPMMTAGLVWNQIDLIDLAQANQDNKLGTGPYIEGCLRQSLVWHPGKTQGWHVGVSLDYRGGYAQTSYRTQTSLGDLNSEVRLWWVGFGGSIFYGRRF